MQRIFGISLPVTARGVSNSNKSLVNVNEMLSKGWTVVDIVCSGDSSSGSLTGFVVLEKDFEDEEFVGNEELDITDEA